MKNLAKRERLVGLSAILIAIVILTMMIVKEISLSRGLIILGLDLFIYYASLYRIRN